MGDEKLAEIRAVFVELRVIMVEHKHLLPPQVARIIENADYPMTTICDMLHEELEEEAVAGNPTPQANFWGES